MSSVEAQLRAELNALKSQLQAIQARLMRGAPKLRDVQWTDLDLVRLWSFGGESFWIQSQRWLPPGVQMVGAYQRAVAF